MDDGVGRAGWTSAPRCPRDEQDGATDWLSVVLVKSAPPTSTTTTIYSRPTSFSFADDDIAARAASSSVARPKPLSCREDRCILRTRIIRQRTADAAAAANLALELLSVSRYAPQHAASQLASSRGKEKRNAFRFYRQE